MINVVKPTDIPDVLAKKGKVENDKNCKKYITNPQAYINSEKKITIDKKIYGYITVKKALKSAQHEKCCFCEKSQVDEYGAVEHYRPKEGYKEKRGLKLKKPGYYWLGYSWSNLYFVCCPCNTRKGAIFPLTVEANRATHHKKNISTESPYLLDPSGKKDPRKHIVFDFQFIRGLTNFGKQTVEVCGLNREGLNTDRMELIDDIKARLAILERKKHHSLEEVKEAENFIRLSIRAEAKFSATAIDYLKRTGIRLI